MASIEHEPAQHHDEQFSPVRRARSVRAGSRRLPDLGVWLGYTVSTVMMGVGIAVMAGYLVHEAVPSRFRWTFGVVLVLMGVYRFFITRLRVQQNALEREEEE